MNQFEGLRSDLWVWSDLWVQRLGKILSVWQSTCCRFTASTMEHWDKWEWPEALLASNCFDLFCSVPTVSIVLFNCFLAHTTIPETVAQYHHFVLMGTSAMRTLEEKNYTTLANKHSVIVNLCILTSLFHYNSIVTNENCVLYNTHGDIRVYTRMVLWHFVN